MKIEIVTACLAVLAAGCSAPPAAPAPPRAPSSAPAPSPPAPASAAAKLDVTLRGTFSDEQVVRDWIARSASVVEKFYGGPPVPELRIVVTATDGDDVGNGTTFGASPPFIRVSVGRDATRDSLRNDWILVHEMIHTALPEVPDEHHWLEEGLATYFEPLARAQAGIVTPESVWSEWVAGMPQGLPRAGDKGLDRTHTWGRTYWGGAVFCLAADIAIREQSQNRHSLQSAMRGLVRRGGNITEEWPIERVLAAGDEATGLHVLRDTYERMGEKPGAVDLAALWQKLGVVAHGKTVTFDDRAPLAAIRRDMTSANSGIASLVIPK